MNIHCKYDSLVPVGELQPHPKNRNKHPQDQIERLAKILMYQGVRAPIVVSRRSGKIVKGHGTLQAIKKNGWQEAPIVIQDFEDDDQEWLFVQSDNAIANWAELDLSGINADIVDLGPFDIDLVGIKNFEVEPLDNLKDNPYTDKIQAPIYEPRGTKPNIYDLYNSEKLDDLLEEIELADLPKEIEGFLRLAAYRHTVFNYDKIADYYAHAPKPVQELMEKSALVIIDFKKAIENGFVTLTQDFTKAYEAHEQ